MTSRGDPSQIGWCTPSAAVVAGARRQRSCRSAISVAVLAAATLDEAHDGSIALPSFSAAKSWLHCYCTWYLTPQTEYKSNRSAVSLPVQLLLTLEDVSRRRVVNMQFW